MSATGMRQKPAESNGTTPYSEAAERAVILSLLYVQEPGPHAILSELAEDDFHTPRFRDLLPALQAFFGENGNLDEAGFTSWLEGRGELERHGGRERIGRLFYDAAKRPVTNVDRELSELKGWTRKRALHDVAAKIQNGVKRGEDPGELAATARRELETLERQNAGLDLTKFSGAACLKDSATFAPVGFAKTGYGKLDAALGGGLAAGEATALFAPSAMGKSCYMVNLAVSLARQRIPTAILSLEMPSCELWKLAVGIVAEIPRLRIRHNAQTLLDSKRFAQAVESLSGQPFWILDRRAFKTDPRHPEAPTMQVAGGIIRDGVKECGWRVVCLDYLAKVGPFDADDLTRIPRLTNWCFDLAQRTGVHIVALAQANKSSWGRQNGHGRRDVALQDVKGCIEAVADMDNVIGLIRDDWNTDTPQDPVELRAVVLKARHGPGGAVPLTFYKATGQILETAGNGEAAELERMNGAKRP